MKTEEITYKKQRLTLSVDDVKELLPDDKFEYQMYRDYRDEIDKDTLKECMPDESKYKDENWMVNYHNFATDWRTNLEDNIREWNVDYITQQIDSELQEKVKEALKKKWVEYDELEFDFYPDDLYSIDLDLDYVLGRSRIDWNVVRHNNFDGFTEWEVYEDEWAIKQIVTLFPDLVDKNDLERACCDWMYTGSDLKVSFRHSMKDFLDIIDKWFIDLSWATAVLHLWINGSWSSDFTLWKWTVEFGKTYDSKYDYWDWELDGHYWIVDVYGWVLNDNY